MYGPKTKPKAASAEKKFGVLEKADDSPEGGKPQFGFANYRPRIPATTVDARVTRAFNWVETRFPPPQRFQDAMMPYYFFYALERAAALHELADVNGKSWFEKYGDVLLSMQAADGSFDRGDQKHTSARIGTAFAILYFMRSTQQILNREYGKGIMTGSRDLASLYGKKKKAKELGPLDELLGGIANIDLDAVDDGAMDDVVEKVQFANPDELIGQVDMLKKLLQSKDADLRKTAYWALGRTGDFNLIPLMMQGIRDPSVDCNVQALLSLRYIARKPNGFGLSLTPLEGSETADDATKVEVANAWRTKAYKVWGNWYRSVRPFEEGGGLDELELSSQN